jgi:putative phage-type endonuclease
MMEKAQWLEERRKGIGASDVAAIMGISPWKTAFQVYQEKRKEAKDWQGSEATDWGSRMEPAIRQWYSDQTGRSVRLPDKVMFSTQYPFMLATLDGFTDDGRIVEIKTARSSHGWGEPGTNEIPDYYALQVQHQMIITGFKVADVPVSIAGGSPVLYEVPEDPTIQQMIIEACIEFWKRVTDGNPPEPVTFADAVARFGKAKGSGDVPVTDSDREAVMTLRDVRNQIKELEEKEEALKGQLIISIGDKGDALVTPEGVPLVTYKLGKGRETLDAKALQKDHMDICIKYLKTGEPSRRFLLK